MPKNSKGRNIAEIIPDKCIGCQLCVGECPVAAIHMEADVAKIDPEICIGCGRCFNVCPVDAVIFEKLKKKELTGVGQKPRPLEDYKGVAVLIEVRNGVGAQVSWELLGKGRELAEKLGAPVYGFLVGVNVGQIAQEAVAYGCDTVYVIDNPLLRHYSSRAYGKVLVQLCEQVKPEVFLLGATPLGRDVSAVIATQLETGLTADCTGLDIDPQERLLLMTRPTFGGNIMATIVCRNHRPQMSTVRPGVMKQLQKDQSRHGEIRILDFTISESELPVIVDFIPTPEDLSGVDITKVPVLVVVGKGACDSRYLPMLEELAQLLGGTIACSRPVVQLGMLPYVRQVGQTGRTVTPKLYIGVGVSGAVQHLVGMQAAEKIIAINIDPHAPLMQMADYAIVGDYLKVVPKLIEGIRARSQATKVKRGSRERNL
jgi:electron transfer flavoprotein alpha subunit/NAD-dependent dihydropyrimidine dehydrogenase PreA subunit